MKGVQLMKSFVGRLYLLNQQNATNQFNVVISGRVFFLPGNVGLR